MMARSIVVFSILATSCVRGFVRSHQPRHASSSRPRRGQVGRGSRRAHRRVPRGASRVRGGRGPTRVRRPSAGLERSRYRCGNQAAACCPGSRHGCPRRGAERVRTVRARHLVARIDRDLFWLETAEAPFLNPAWYLDWMVDNLDPAPYLTRNYAPLETRMRAYTTYAHSVQKAADQIRANMRTPLVAPAARTRRVGVHEALRTSTPATCRRRLAR